MDEQLQALTSRLTVLRNNRAAVTREIEREQRRVDRIRQELWGTQPYSEIEPNDSPEAA